MSAYAQATAHSHGRLVLKLAEYKWWIQLEGRPDCEIIHSL